MRNMQAVLLVGFLFCGSAWSWTYEQVDVAGNWFEAEIGVMPSGTICVCYTDTLTDSIVLARKDSIGAWRHEALGTENGSAVGRHLVQGPHGRPAVLMGSNPITFKVDTDTGWVTTQLGWAGYGGSRTYLAFDTAGRPSVIWCSGSGGGMIGYLSSAIESAGVWVQDTLRGWSPPYWPYYYGNVGYVLDGAGRFNLLYMEYFEGHGANGAILHLRTGRTKHWTDSVIPDQSVYASALSLAPRGTSGVSVCYRRWGVALYCDSSLLDTRRAVSSLVQADAQGRREAVYRTDGSVTLNFAYETSTWNFDTLPSRIDYHSLDFALDAEGIRLIVFISDQGVFLARAEPISCTEPTPPPTLEHLTMPTLVRGVLELPEAGMLRCAARYWLLDISGRKVLDLHPGANDVSRLAPGIYFVRSANAERRTTNAELRSATTRVVIAK